MNMLNQLRSAGWRTPLKFALVLAVAVVLCSNALAGTWDRVKGFGPNDGKILGFTYVPDDPQQPAPLVIVLHGGGQNAKGYSTDAGWTTLADKWRFVILAPEQPQSRDSDKHFKWFEPLANQKGAREAKWIMQMVDQVASEQKIDRKRVYCTGLSAGGAMTAVMLAYYPKDIAAGAIVAGLPFACATKEMPDAILAMFVPQQLTQAARGDAVRNVNSGYTGPWPRVSIWHGTKDMLVRPANATELLKQWTNVHGIDQKPEVSNTVKGYPHKVYEDNSGNPLVETYFITDMGHATPVDPGTGEDQGGATSDYVVKTNIFSSYYIGLFFGLNKGATPSLTAEFTADVAQ